MNREIKGKKMEEKNSLLIKITNYVLQIDII